MSKYEVRKKAIALRRKGYSLKELSEILGVSKSTISFWCSSVTLTHKQKARLIAKMIDAGHAGRIAGASSNHKKKIDAQNMARKDMEDLLGDVSKRDKFLSGISLYWAEGSKASSTTGFIFVNSDPKMILFMYYWLINMMDVKKEDVYIHISINKAHIIREDKVLNFWSNLLDLPRHQFSKPFYSKVNQKKVFENYDEYYGVCRLGVRKSTYLKYKVLALIDVLKENAGVAQVVRANAS